MTGEQPIYHVEIRITPREGILDPEGETIGRALQELGYSGVEQVRAGRLVRLGVRGNGAGAVRERVEEMCRELIANPVIEDFDVRVREETGERSPPGETAGTRSPGEGAPA